MVLPIVTKNKAGTAMEISSPEHGKGTKELEARSARKVFIV